VVPKIEISLARANQPASVARIDVALFRSAQMVREDFQSLGFWCRPGGGKRWSRSD